MFEEPQAKRIRRSEAFEDTESGKESHSEGKSSNINATEQNDGKASELAYHFDYDLVENSSGQVIKFANLKVHEAFQEDAKEEEFEFRLFSNTKPSVTKEDTEGTLIRRPAQTKINIRSPTPDTPSDGRFNNPYRPPSFYFANEPPLDNFAATAVSGQEVLQWSQGSWPGASLPWRVIHLPRSKVSVSALSSTAKAMLKVSDPATRRKRKPSKKRRILLRTKAKAVEAKVKEKEEHLREKKTRLNREKKMKRKAKEKAAKLAGKEEGDGGVSGVA